jgi:N-acetylmuramoyl-L-alanine amidase
MKAIAALWVSVAVLAAQTERAAPNRVTAVRHWPTGDTVRVAIEVNGEFEFLSDKLPDPSRVYFDILEATPQIEGRRGYSRQIDGKLLKRIRVAQTTPSVTRVVLDLAADASVVTTKLTNPYRLIVELRPPDGVALPADAPVSSIPPGATVTPPAILKAETPKPEPLAEPSKAQLAKPAVPTPGRKSTILADTVPPERSLSETAKAARHTSTGQTSLVRALGLKITRVLIDPGHGGHDHGTSGPKGLLEKDLVLDVSMRVGKLVSERMGAEVIYTRTDDTFVPLEGRTALANEKKADLFLSIHANSSPVARTAGVETYYLNYTDSQESLDVAARENASAQKSVFELRDMIQKIALHDKAEESKEFAARIQASLHAFSVRNVPGSRNRGVKKAPFVVLIGASMPSVLAEIGFLSNPREEALLKKADYRAKLAEAIFRGISRYASSLSHFQVARAQE